jgi:hypothetical protein
LQGGNQVVRGFRCEIKAAIMLGKALCSDHSVQARSLRAQADDVDRELRRSVVKRLADAAGRTSAGILAIGQDHNHTRLTAKVEDFGSLFDGPRQRRTPAGHQALRQGYDLCCGVRRRTQIKLDIVALIEEPGVMGRSVAHQSHAAKPCDARQDLAERVAHHIDAPDRLRGLVAPDFAGHRPRCIEDEHGVVGAGGTFAVKGKRREAPAQDR